VSDYRDIALWCENGYPTSTVMTENGPCLIPNFGHQEWVMAFARAAIERGRVLLGVA
jgi:hypothetical protein